MSLGIPPQGGVPKKDSIFSSIAPALSPAATPSMRPTADPEAIGALKQKIDSLEKNIVSQLEKKFGDPQPAAPRPPPPPPAAVRGDADLLYRKIEELERRLSDFGHAASLSASQLKNIEESKVSARREIEDLLKAVREQQKYSEMDRQMHEQLEKAWTRAEEMEKKLMDFYSSVLAMETKRRDESAASSDKSAAAIEALSARIAGLEARLSSGSSSALDTVSARLAGLEETISAHNSRPEVEDIRRAREEFFSRADAERRASAAEKNAEFKKAPQDDKSKSESAEAALEASARRQALALEEFSRRLEDRLRAANSDFAEALRKEGDERMKKFGAKYADALLSVAFVHEFRAALSGSIGKLEACDKEIASLLKDVSPAQLEKVLGVSGAVIRRRFELLASFSRSFKQDAAGLRAIKREVEERFKDIFGEPR